MEAYYLVEVQCGLPSPPLSTSNSKIRTVRWERKAHVRPLLSKSVSHTGLHNQSQAAIYRTSLKSATPDPDCKIKRPKCAPSLFGLPVRECRRKELPTFYLFTFSQQKHKLNLKTSVLCGQNKARLIYCLVDFFLI